MIPFFRLVGKLKRLRRQGWVDRGVPSPESVAEHTFRMAVMAWTLGAAAGLDTGRLLKLVLVHDLPEVLAGDTTPYTPLVAGGLDAAEAAARWRELLAPHELLAGRTEKHRRERQALSELVGSLGPEIRDEMRGLWEEYASGGSPEARFVAQIDKFEALLQAIEYQEAGYPADVESFRHTAEQTIHHPLLRALLADLGRVPPRITGAEDQVHGGEQ